MALSLTDDVIAAVGREEGWREYVYDDYSGNPVTRGSQLIGFPTIGYGFRIDAGGEPMPKEVADLWRRIIVEKRIAELTARWQPFNRQPYEVKCALVEMAFQLGVSGLLKFGLMLGALERGDRATAAVNVVASRFGEQTPARAQRVADLIRGHEVEDIP